MPNTDAQLSRLECDNRDAKRRYGPRPAAVSRHEFVAERLREYADGIESAPERMDGYLIGLSGEMTGW